MVVSRLGGLGLEDPESVHHKPAAKGPDEVERHVAPRARPGCNVSARHDVVQLWSASGHEGGRSRGG